MNRVSIIRDSTKMDRRGRDIVSLRKKATPKAQCSTVRRNPGLMCTILEFSLEIANAKGHTLLRT